MAVRPGGAALPGRPRLFAPTAVIVLVLLVLGGVYVAQYTDYLWFQEAKHGNVFSTVLKTKIVLFLVFGVLMSLAIGASIAIAYRTRPPFQPLSLEQQNLERYRVALEPFLLPVLLVVSLFFGVFAGLSAAARWDTWLLFSNRTPFGIEDQQFHKDISFFTFTYPFLRFVLGYVFVVLVLALLAAAITHYLFGGVRLQAAGDKLSIAARVHLSVMVGLIVAAKAVAYYLDRYGLAFSERGVVQGASYTDVHAVLPAKTMLMIVAALCALLFFANVVVRNVVLPAGALAILVVSAVGVGGIYPFFVQQYKVRPNEVVRESPYIKRNIDATRAAYKLEGTKITKYDGKSTATKADLAADTGTIPNARILDPNILGPSFTRQQNIRNYFDFNPSLDIDRYTVNGKTQDYVVAVRELDQSKLRKDQQNWINLHLSYTHGNGFVAAPANRAEDDGFPAFTVKDLPVNAPKGSDFEALHSQIYYGEKSPTYSIVDTKQGEIDGPGSSDPDSDESLTHYEGTGGVKLDSGFRKLLYALKFREKNILLSGSLTDESKLMYTRQPRERVQKVAPFLKLDSDPYPAVVEGQLVWILDGYTTSSGYPYAQSTQLGELASDSRGRVQTNADVNYIRNSVKATVNAYSGAVKLYTWDDEDPVLKTWKKAFPGLVLAKSEISPELASHFRYPEDLFKVQRSLLSSYHVTDPGAFYGKEDFWQVPADPTQNASRSLSARASSSGATAAPTVEDDNSGLPQPPYYSLLQFPGQDATQFSLTSTFVARGASNLTAFASVSSDPEDYGVIRVLELPKSTNIPGPGQVANNFETSTLVSNKLLPLRNSGSDVVLGNLLTLPVAGGLLYVEPVYAQSKSGAKFPVYNSVIVSFGNKIAQEKTLAAALDSLFGPGAGTSSPPEPGEPTTPSGSSVAELTAEAQDAYADAQAALKSGDFATYGNEIARLKRALDALTRATGATPTPSPSAS